MGVDTKVKGSIGKGVSRPMSQEPIEDTKIIL